MLRCALRCVSPEKEAVCCCCDEETTTLSGPYATISLLRSLPIPSLVLDEGIANAEALKASGNDLRQGSRMANAHWNTGTAKAPFKYDDDVVKPGGVGQLFFCRCLQKKRPFSRHFHARPGRREYGNMYTLLFLIGNVWVSRFVALAMTLPCCITVYSFRVIIFVH